MEHVVEKCRNALSQFIEPKIGFKEDGVREASLMSSVSATKSLLPPARTPKLAPTPPLPPPLPPLLLEFLLDKDLELKADEEDDEDEDVSDICIVKVEFALEVAHRLATRCGEGRLQPVRGCGRGRPVVDPKRLGQCGGHLRPSGSSRSSHGCPGAGGSLGAGRSQGPLPVGFSSGNPLKNIKCTKCPAMFQGVEKLVFHRRAQHFIFMCPCCSKQFNHNSNFNHHMNVHCVVKSYSCGTCGKWVTQKSMLHDHLNLHSGAQP